MIRKILTPVENSGQNIGDFFSDFFPSIVYALLMTRRRMQIMAITSSRCMMPPAAYPKNPIAQTTTKITAIR
jgi:hypothetical protein